MIEGKCVCGKSFSEPESVINQPTACRKCNAVFTAVSAEALAEGAGAGDFDALLIVRKGPSRVGEQFFLGGVPEIQIGKLPDRQIQLVGTQVSRGHAKLSRVDFGPSRWNIEDNKSTNGVFVNGTRVTSQELQPGDKLRIGEFELEFQSQFEAQAPVVAQPQAPAAKAVPPGGPICPSCEQALAPGAKYCIQCGINITTGRPLLTANAVDDEEFAEKARAWIRWISILIPVTPLPMPIRSEAMGGSKPYTIWTIAILTAIASLGFFIAQSNDRHGDSQNLMLWSPYSQGSHRTLKTLKLTQRQVQKIVDEMSPDEEEQFQEIQRKYKGKVPDDQLAAKAITEMFQKQLDSIPRGEFHWYQLITHAFLHDTSSLWNFVMHFGGNMLFMLVFGTRVNALIGNIATAIVYPILAVAAASTHLVAEGASASGPMLGASGAIMGLAGMYLVLFPIQRVFCAMWIRIWLRFRTYFGCKVFALRGFWILLIYFGYDFLMQAISSHFGISGGVAHWAHIGGFVSGMLVALTILISRLVNCRGNDILSVAFGKGAWPLLGKPSRWIKTPEPAAPRAVSLSYPGN